MGKTRDWGAGRKEFSVLEPLKTFNSYLNSHIILMTNLQCQVVVPKGTYAKCELLRRTGELGEVRSIYVQDLRFLN